MLNYNLMTPYADSFDKSAPLLEYPRPQFVRNSYLNLNGEWDFTFAKAPDCKTDCNQKITVPYSPESVLSGIGRAPQKDEYLVYRKTAHFPADFIKSKTLLHIGAVDQECEIFVNGISFGSFANGYLPIECDISNAVKVGDNELCIIVKDSLSYLYPTGKQRAKRGGIWYTPVSGIWQTVWAESLPEKHIESAKITPNFEEGSVKIEVVGAKDFEAKISFAGEEIFAGNFNSLAEIKIPEPKYWSPEVPNLYDLTLKSGEDEVKSYFALRKFEAKNGRFYLNGKPYFVNGLLDQGYFSDGIYTPASYDAFKGDILSMKALGFNALRKHIKIEPMAFYHLCDKLGMLVLQDTVNVGKYSFFKDTILPFAGFKGFKKPPYINVNRKQQESFTEHSKALVKYLYNCPSVVYYTIFNEGWGQFDGDKLYKILKEEDPTRVYDSTSGWFWQNLSDVTSYHIYFKPIKLAPSERPIIVSEFGGYSHVCKGHEFNTSKTFGYRIYKDLQEFEDDFVKLYTDEISGNLKNGLAGAIYTQVSDVEDECNGILTYDRKVCKLNAQRILPLMQKINETANS